MVFSIQQLACQLHTQEGFKGHYREMFHWLEIQNLQKEHHFQRIFQLFY